MKKVILIVGFLLLIFGAYLFQTDKKEQTRQVLPAADAIVSPTSEVQKTNNEPARQRLSPQATAGGKKFLFVPYWGQTAEKIPDLYGNTLIYFGIAPNSSGIDTKDDGYLGLARFEAISKGRETLLTLRMVDKDINFLILKDKKLQEKIIADTTKIARQYGFSGIVLDLEISSLPFAIVTDQMDNFAQDFSKAAKKEHLTFSMMFFGDTFYRIRPYDTLVLRQYLDMVFVMAYDFSKAKGDPGPNFPFGGKETYGYDFTVMVNDFLNIVPKEKLVIVFGMFGYDWTVDDQNKSIKQAQAQTLTVAKKQFIEQCLLKNCSVRRDEQSSETTVMYIDKEGNNHTVWFEDEESVAKKREFLKEKGIKSVGYWAYSYY